MVVETAWGIMATTDGESVGCGEGVRDELIASDSRRVWIECKNENSEVERKGGNSPRTSLKTVAAAENLTASRSRSVQSSYDTHESLVLSESLY